jgi:hypothetical protein
MRIAATSRDRTPVGRDHNMKQGATTDRDLVVDAATEDPATDAIDSAESHGTARSSSKAASTPGLTDGDAAAGGGGGGLVRLTVNLTPRAFEAMERAGRMTGDSKTDTVNRALRIYALIHELSAQGGGSLTIINKDGEKETIHIV